MFVFVDLHVRCIIIVKIHQNTEFHVPSCSGSVVNGRLRKIFTLTACYVAFYNKITFNKSCTCICFLAVLPVVIFVLSVVSAAAASQVRFSVIVFLVIMGSSKVRCRCMLLDCARIKVRKSRLGSRRVEMSGARTHAHKQQHCELRSPFPLLFKE